jgi:hypothetical protein
MWVMPYRSESEGVVRRGTKEGRELQLTVEKQAWLDKSQRSVWSKALKTETLGVSPGGINRQAAKSSETR